MGLVDDKAIAKFAREHVPDLTKADKEALAEKYTPAQMDAVLAGEKAVSSADIVKQGRFRTELEAARAGINYYDDFSKIQPIIDHRLRTPEAAQNVPLRFTTMDQEMFEADLQTFLDGFVKDKNINWDELSIKERLELAKASGPQDMDIFNYLFNRPALVHADRRTRVLPEELGNSSLAPGMRNNIPGMSDAKTQAMMQSDGDEEGLDEPGMYKDLSERTGLKVSEIFNLPAKEVVVRLVSNQTRLGKVRSYSVIAIAGNGDGHLGLGSAKSTEFSVARAKAREKAIRNMLPIPRYERRTIYGNVEHKISGTVVRLFSRPPGRSPLSAIFLSPTLVLRMLTVRLRSPRSSPHFRNGPCRRSAGPCRQDPSLAQPHERRQGHLCRPHEPARPGADCHWPR